MVKLGDKTKEIDERAMALLKSVFGDIDTLKFPINLDDILEHCNLTLKEGSFENDDLAGALDRDKRTIYIAESDPSWRKNFTIAHELGHFKLHEDVKTDVFFRYQVKQLMSPVADEHESQANWFAASLLMPEKPLKKLRKTFKDVSTLSQIFGVSKSAMRYRLKNLSLTK